MNCNIKTFWAGQVKHQTRVNNSFLNKVILKRNLPLSYLIFFLKSHSSGAHV